MRLIDADELIKCIPSEEYNSKFAVIHATTIKTQNEIIRCNDCRLEGERMVGKEEAIWRLARLIATMSNSARFEAFHLTDVEDVFVYYSYKEANKLYEAYRESLREGAFA